MLNEMKLFRCDYSSRSYHLHKAPRILAWPNSSRSSEGRKQLGCCCTMVVAVLHIRLTISGCSLRLRLDKPTTLVERRSWIAAVELARTPAEASLDRPQFEGLEPFCAVVAGSVVAAVGRIEQARIEPLGTELELWSNEANWVYI